jgi:1,4-dihydroxy-2-naphthoyl-CoA synthase
MSTVAGTIEVQQLLFQSDDAREGINAYVQKRKPVFKGQ